MQIDKQFFQIESNLSPAGDQPEAIDKLSQGLEQAHRDQILLGVTGSGKTFTMAGIVARVQRPTLVIAPNKILAAQLFSEFKELFPTMRLNTSCPITIIISRRHTYLNQILT